MTPKTLSFGTSSGSWCNLQAWSEWLADAGGVFEMVDWTGKSEVKEGGHELAPIIRGLIDRFGFGLGRTKTASLATDKTLGNIRVGQGFDEMYRRACATY